MDYDFDLIVIGSGAGGGVGAEQAASLGKKVAVVGRLRSLRPHGKITFADVEDATGKMQLFFSQAGRILPLPPEGVPGSHPLLRRCFSERPLGLRGPYNPGKEL